MYHFNYIYYHLFTATRDSFHPTNSVKALKANHCLLNAMFITAV